MDNKRQMFSDKSTLTGCDVHFQVSTNAVHQTHVFMLNQFILQFGKCIYINIFIFLLKVK